MSVINRNSGSPIFNTLAEAQASNMNVGQLPIVLGTSSAFDGGGVIYSVQPNGSGGLAMSNGNELVQYTGTAAVLDAQTSLTDTTEDRLMTVGAFGLGIDKGLDVPNEDIDDAVSNGFYRVTSTDANRPPTGGGFGTLLVQTRSSTTSNIRVSQIFISSSTGVWFRINSNGVWGSWQEFYHTGNLLGTVSESAGVPTGAVIERGSNANGEYVKFADGTMICTHRLDLTYNSGNDLRTVWTFPAVFASTPSTLAMLQSNSANRTDIPIPAGGVWQQAIIGLSVFTESATAANINAWAEPSVSFISTSELREIPVTATGRWF